MLWLDLRPFVENSKALKAMTTSTVKKNVESNIGEIYIYGFVYCPESK